MRRHATTPGPNALRSLLVAGMLCSTAVSAGTLSQELQDILSTTPATQKVSVILPMTSKVDPNEVAGALGGSAERLSVIVGALKTKATATQNQPICGRPGLVDELAAAGSQRASNIRRLWAVNAVVVDAVPAVVRSAGGRGDIGQVHFAGNREVEAPPATSSLPQWNITRVGAPTAWGRGFTGTGGIVASIDTGADASHPDLAATLLRNASNQPVWRDAVGGQLAPYDDDGHGTHLLGVAVGRNGYGVAPDAKWMSCKAFTRSGTMLVTTAPRILECAQWVLNPQHPALTDSAPPDPAYIPDVVMSDLVISGAGYCDPFLADVIRVWRAARILPVWSVGDDPILAPVGAVPSPANDPATFSVAAADQSDAIVSTAFRGLAFCPGPTRMAPRLVAPGVNVSATWPGNQHKVRQGSDVAAAHVAGAAALVRGARPDLRRVSVDILDDALERTGVPVTGGQRRLDVDAAVTLQDADFVEHAPPPPTIVTGQSVTVTVTMLNRGVTSWKAPNHALRFIGTGSWAVTSMPVPFPVLPGEEVAFTFNVTAPMTPGTYVWQWRMCEGTTCFGEPSLPVPPIIVVGTDVATFVSQDVPCRGPGVAGTATVTFRNTGTNTWTSPDYVLGKLGTYSDPQNVGLPGGQPVPPNATVTFSVPLSGPFPTGRYTFQRRMRRGGTWFGEAGSVWLVDTNTCVPDGASLAGVSAPTELRSGQGATVSVWATNNGITTWRAGYCLRVASPAIVGGTASACVGVPPTVSPTQTVFFSVPITAIPQGVILARWPISARMYDDYGDAFGTVWSSTLGVPRDHQGSTDFATGTEGQGYKNWFYRYHSGSDNTWKKMTWKGNDHWEGSGASQIIRATSMHPGDNNAVGRFWKSPLTGWVRASANVADLDPSCGDGVVVRIRKNTQLLGEWSFANGGGGAIGAEAMVDINDTIRFIVVAANNNNCDSTQLDPLLQVLPPAHPSTGLVPPEGATANPQIEPAGVIP